MNFDVVFLVIAITGIITLIGTGIILFVLWVIAKMKHQNFNPFSGYEG